MYHPRYALMQTEKESGIHGPCSGQCTSCNKAEDQISFLVFVSFSWQPCFIIENPLFLRLVWDGKGMGEPKSRETENNIFIII